MNNEVELEQKKKALKPISEEELKQCNMIDLIEMLTERLKDCRFDKRTLELCQPMLDKLARQVGDTLPHFRHTGDDAGSRGRAPFGIGCE